MHELTALIHDEFQAKRDDDGCTPEQLADLRARFDVLRAEGKQHELEELYTALQNVQPRQPGPWQPSNLAGIHAARGDGPRSYAVTLSDDGLEDKILGGLLGRAAGCALGKPVEGWPRADIEAYIAAFGETDVADYIPFSETVPLGASRAIDPLQRAACRGEIRFMPRDDDMDYTVLGLHVLHHVGPNFTTADMARLWLQTLPYHCTYTAERVAYRNLVHGRTPPETAYCRNPYREWIGAQIRADGFGYAAPGQPALAAEWAWRDARLSHVKNGIYGAMWVAAAVAAAFVTDNVHEVIAAATAQIPRESRFTAMVEHMLVWHRHHDDWRACWNRIHYTYGHLHRVHTINNAALVLLGLLYGGHDLGKTIGIAVQGGWDTDCNGATAGSILGVILGARALPQRWVQPFNNTLETAVFGYHYPKFTDLARMATNLARRTLDGSRQQ